MTDEQKNNQILTQQPPETISPASDEFDRPAFTNTDSISAPTATPAEISPVEDDLTTANEPIENSAEISPVEDDLTITNEPTENSAEISPVENDLTATSELTETPAENPLLENDLTTARELTENSAETPPLENDLTTDRELTENTSAQIPSNEDNSTAIYPTAIVPIPAEDSPDISPIKTDLPASNQIVKAEPKSTPIWQLLMIFMSGMLVGSVLSLGTLVAWRIYQERANIQIKLPADVPLPQSPSPAATAPARQLAGIPPAPVTASPLPTNIPSPNPTQIPSLSGVPQLASPSPLPSPSPSPSPAAETAVTDRVNFEVGATGTTLTNTLPDNKSKRYLIDCQGGQTMTLNIPEGAVSATIIAPNGEKIGTANSTTPWEGQLPSSGDYTIEISGESQANYGVKIEVK
jgi:hypothetical protein